jgi:N-formylglutamate amidohydrolase
MPHEPAVPLVFDSPHSGSEYPEDFGYEVALDRLRQSEDSWVDDLYATAPRHGAALLAARFPRSYIDPNRTLADLDPELLAEPWPDAMEPSAKTRLGMGLVWRLLNTGEAIYTRRLSQAEIRHRIDRFYRPYHAALSGLLDETHRRFGRFWHVNCHSMPSVAGRNAVQEEGTVRPDFVLGDRDGTSCAPGFTAFVQATLEDMGYDVRINDPYKGVELVRAYSDPRRGRHSLQIEVNRKLYMDESTLARSAGFPKLQRDLERLVLALREYATERS